MARYRKKPVEIEATQWWQNGDHPEDYSLWAEGFEGEEPAEFSPEFQEEQGWEGQVVRYYRHPEDDPRRRCDTCGCAMHHHGWIDTAEGGHIVCPGDYIITGVRGERYPCKPDIFRQTYDPVEE